MAVALGDAQIVLKSVVCGGKGVVELVPFEEIVVTARLVARAILRIDRPANSPERPLLPLDPDQDGLLYARVVDSVDDSLGEAALR